MAICSTRIEAVSRSKGHNIVAAAAYRRAEVFKDERLSVIHDYSKKQGNIYSDFSLPENSFSWIDDLKQSYQDNSHDTIEKFWNAVDSQEKRKDSQLARNLYFALPIELHASQNIDLMKDCMNTFTREGMIADWSIHFDVGNPHAHVLLTMREITESGFGKKVEAWNDWNKYKAWRFEFSEITNTHLARHGIDARIDPRSYKEQGIDLRPTKHMGKKISSQEARGIETERLQEQRDIQKENLQRIQENPDILFHAISKQTSNFSTEKVAQTLSRYVNPHDGEFSVFSSEFLQSKQEDISVSFNAFEPVICERVLENIEQVSVNEPVKETIEKPLTSFEQILGSIEKHESVFSEADVSREVFKLTPDADLFGKTLAAVKKELRQHRNVLSLGFGDDGRERFTTRHLFKVENEAINLSIKKESQKQFFVNDKLIEKALEQRHQETGKTLTGEQKDALRHLTQSSGLSCMVGRAGTGKSFTVGTVKIAYELAGFNVQGVALSGVASDGLSRDAAIPSRTIDSFLLSLEHNPTLLHEKSVLIMDEAGMTDSHSMLSILKAVHAAKAKLILLGDPDQLQPVGPGAIFRGILERLGYIEIQTIYRQKEIWQKEATKAFARGEVVDALTAYEERGCVHLEATDNDAMNKLVADWKLLLDKENAITQQLVITYRNEDVRQLNHLLRQTLVNNRTLSEGYHVQAKSGVKHIATGERLLFLENNRRLGVKNGRFSTVTSVDFLESGRVRSFKVKLDGHDQEIIIDPKKYNHFDYGYAATVHKTQGVTTGHTFVYVTKDIWSRALSYVAMTRHRFNAHLYASKESFLSMDFLKRSLQKFSIKDSVLDFPLAFARRRGIEPNTHSLPYHLSQKLQSIVEKISGRYQRWRDPIAYRSAQKQQETNDARDKQRFDAQIVAQYADIHREIGKQWRELQEKLKSEGITVHHPDFKQSIRLLPEYSGMLTNQARRDAMAANIVSNVDYYAKAIELNRLAMTTLEKHANTHTQRKKITAYQTALKHNATLLAQKIAFSLSADIKQSYALLKSLDVDVAALNHHANTYHQRLAKASLSRDERKAFDRVMSYQDLLKQSAPLLSKLKDYYQAEKHPEACIKLQEKLLALGKQKSAIAATILKNRDSHIAGLDYVEIGKGIDLKRAERRWFQLQQAASFHDRTEQKTLSVALAKETFTHTHIGDFPPKLPYTRIDISRLKADLNEQAEHIALHYLGQPRKQANGQLRYGDNNGSLFVTLTGNKQGHWYDFQTAEGGDMLSLISHATGKDFKDSLKEAIDFLGGESRYVMDNTLTSEQVALRAKKQQAMMAQVAAEQAKKLQHVQAIAHGTQPIAGTLAEKYLREHRGIQGTLNSDNLRFHPALKNWVTGDLLPALVILAHDDKNQLSGVQATFLDPITANKAKLEGATKLSRGSISQGSIVHVANPSINVENSEKTIESPIIALAEGLESALSVADAHPDWQVNVTFGVSNFERVATHVAQCSADVVDKNPQQALPNQHVVNVGNVARSQPTIIICADNDGINSGTAKAVKKAVDNLHVEGIAVHVVEPEKPDHIEKFDFNDALKTHGVDIIRTGLDKKLSESIRGNAGHLNTTYVLENQREPIAVTTEKTFPTTKQPVPLINQLLDYVQSEIKQKELLLSHYRLRSGENKEQALVAKNEMLTHGKVLSEKAYALLQQEEVQHLITEARQMRLKGDSINFEELRQHLTSGSMELKNIYPLFRAMQTRQQAIKNSLSQKQSKGRHR